MKQEEKDAICQLWVEIFGTQEGVGYNCPQGAYDFAKVAMAYEREACAKVCENGMIGDPSSRHDYERMNCAAAIRARSDK